MPTFPTPEPITAVVDVSGFELRLRAGDDAETTVEVRPHNPSRQVDVDLVERTTIDFADGRLEVRTPRTVRSRLRNLVGGSERADVVISLPTGSSLEVRGWGDIVADGTLGEVEIDTGLGDVALSRVGRLRAKTSMGDIRVDATAGPADLRTSAGSIRVGRAEAGLTASTSAGDVTVGEGEGDLQLSTSAGDLRVDRAASSVTARTSAGDVRLGSVRRGVVSAESTYGRLEIGVAHGSAAWLDVSAQHGVVRSGLEPTDGPGDAEQTVEIHASAGFGDIVLSRS